MSKGGAIILSVAIEAQSQAETARLYKVSEATVSSLIARYRADPRRDWHLTPRGGVV